LNHFYSSAAHSDSIVSEDAAVEPRAVATLALKARRSSHLETLTTLQREHPAFQNMTCPLSFVFLDLHFLSVFQIHIDYLTDQDLKNCSL
jgi:hypothetical protein